MAAQGSSSGSGTGNQKSNLVSGQQGSTANNATSSGGPTGTQSATANSRAPSAFQIARQQARQARCTQQRQAKQQKIIIQNRWDNAALPPFSQRPGNSSEPLIEANFLRIFCNTGMMSRLRLYEFQFPPQNGVAITNRERRRELIEDLLQTKSSRRRALRH